MRRRKERARGRRLCACRRPRQQLLPTAHATFIRRELSSLELADGNINRAYRTVAATVERICYYIQLASLVHLACHGIQDRTNALESGFHLSDGMLIISKLMALELDQPWFGYLSACETAKGDAEQPDQVMHLAAAMLFAGFKSVVATMW
jgi:CHAT domain-containing protein